MRTSGRSLRSTWPTPVMVPPVPTPATKASSCGSWARISGAVVAVDLRVGGIRELLRHVPVGALGEHLLGLADGAVHAFRVGREHERGAVGAQEGAALLAHRVRHGEH